MGCFPEDLGGCIRGPGVVPCGVLPEIESAKMLPMTNKTDVPYAQGSPELGPLDVDQRDCDLGRWQQSQCFRGS